MDVESLIRTWCLKYCRRPLEEDPRICRALSRFLWFLAILAGLAIVFYFLFNSAPIIIVQRVYLEKNNSDYATQRMFSSSRSYGSDIDAASKTREGAVTDLYTQYGVVIANDSNTGEEQNILNCPCTSQTLTWTDFVSFRLLNATPPIGFMNYTDVPSGVSLIANVPKTIDPVYLSKDSDILTVEKFCESNMISLLPSRNYSASFDMDCPDLATSLLTTEVQPETQLRSSWDNPRAYFESPNLLDQQFLYSNTLRRLYGE